MFIRLQLIALCLCGILVSTVAQASPRERVFVSKTRHVVVGGASIAYYERGVGRPLVMLIGSHSTMSEWDPQLIADLAKSRRLIMVDYRGVGLSGGNVTDSPTIAAMADDTAAFINRLGQRRVDALGWSMGGMVAQQLTVRHPELVRRLVLAATNPGGRRAVLGPDRYIGIEDDPSSTEAEQLETLFAQNSSGRRAAKAFLDRVETAANVGEVPDDFEVSKSAYRVQTEAETRWLKSDANYKSLSTVRKPTLVAGGGLDVLTPYVNSARIASQIRSSKLRLYETGGHAFLFQFNRSFAASVSRFLS